MQEVGFLGAQLAAEIALLCLAALAFAQHFDLPGERLRPDIGLDQLELQVAFQFLRPLLVDRAVGLQLVDRVDQREIWLQR